MISYILYLITVILTETTHEEIIKWWNKISDQKPYQCTLNEIYKKPFHPTAEKFVKTLHDKPYISIKQCEENDTKLIDFTFKGKIVNGQPIGPGKLKIQQGSKTFPAGDLKAINAICLYKSKAILEVVGTFQNDTFNGPAKVVFTNGEKIVANFSNGIPKGPVRKWKHNNQLSSLYHEENHELLTKHRKWKLIKEEFLIWTDESIINEDEEFWSVFVPLDLSKEIFVGKLDTILGLAEDLHLAEVEITSLESDCFLTLNWKLKERLNYKLSLLEKGFKIPEERIDSELMCKAGQIDNLGAKDAFLVWEHFISEHLNFKGVHITSKEMIHMLSFLKPETSTLQSEKVKKKFLSKVSIFTENNQILANMSHWEGKIATWKPNKISLDLNGKLHGVCGFDLLPEFYNKTGTHDFFHWSLKHFSGRFVHGKLEGYVSFLTWQGTVMLATFNNGELHGPAIALGRTVVYDIWVRNVKVSLTFYFEKSFKT